MSTGTGKRVGTGVLTRRPQVIEPPGPRVAVTILILAGAVLTVLSGVVHLHLWAEANGYRTIPTIGPLFLAQGIVAILLGVATAVTRWLAAVLAAAGLLISTAAGLLLSIEVGLFGFKDSWVVPFARSSFIGEIAGGVLLLIAAFLMVRPPGARAPIR
jgi:hypothetical protein